jgi:outer membrane protein OmpA-like peptidoglycan-associated protein
MSRALAIVLAGAGMADLALIDLVLAPRLFSDRAETESAVAAAGKSEVNTDTRPSAEAAHFDSPVSNRESLQVGAVEEAERGEPEVEVSEERPGQEKPETKRPSPGIAKGALGATDQKTWLLLFPAAKQDWVPRQAEKPLASIARHINASPNHDVLVLGHCDARGTREANFDLGERRARAIAQRLVSLGVDETRIQIRSFGEEQPAVDGSNGYAWSRNRRVEVVLRPHETRSLNR